MSIREKIRNLIVNRCADLVVRDVRIGLGYTAVQLDDGRTGLAYTMQRERLDCCSFFRGSLPLVGKPAEELLRFLESDNPLEVTVGLATANAISNVLPPRGGAGDVLSAIELFPTDVVGMVGYFGPLVRQLEERVARLEIFEESPTRGLALRSALDAPETLRQCQVACITSTAILNDTIDRLLESASACREVILLGPSTPLLPQAFDGSPVTMLSGMVVHDPHGIMRVVSEGGGTRLFSPYATKWNLSLRECLVPQSGNHAIRPRSLTAFVVVNNGDAANPLVQQLLHEGFAVSLFEDPGKSIAAAKLDPPSLVIAEHLLNDMTGVGLLTEFLRISWTTHTILIADEVAETVHNMTEGLGILGHVRGTHDEARLSDLLKKFRELT
jgi:uncharacterized protein (DUF4213/DUF364 family)